MVTDPDADTNGPDAQTIAQMAVDIDADLDGGLTDLAARVTAARQQAMNEALANTDWRDTPIVDVLTPVGLPPDWTPDDPFEFRPIRVARYERRAPPLDAYAQAVDGRVEVTRVTRPLLERLQDDEDLAPSTRADIDAILGA